MNSRLHRNFIKVGKWLVGLGFLGMSFMLCDPYNYENAGPTPLNLYPALPSSLGVCPPGHERSWSWIWDEIPPVIAQ